MPTVRYHGKMVREVILRDLLQMIADKLGADLSVVGSRRATTLATDDEGAAASFTVAGRSVDGAFHHMRARERSIFGFDRRWRVIQHGRFSGGGSGRGRLPRLEVVRDRVGPRIRWIENGLRASDGDVVRPIP